MKRFIAITVILICFVMCGCGKRNSEPQTECTIKITYTQNSNYVYHMLAVAGCGYDSTYKNSYVDIYDASDLETLKEYETLISVSGGEHEGILYGLLIAQAAALPDEASIETYYRDLIAATDESDEYGKEIRDIATVMLNNFSVYCEKVWPQVQPALRNYTDELQLYFSDTNYLNKWEEALGYKAKRDFEALICEAIDGGPEAILITDYQDIFALKNMERYENRVSFISHEAGMALVKQNGFLGIQSTQELLEKYHVLESTIEYYNRKIVGYELEGTWDYQLVNKIEELDESGNYIGIEELFGAAWEDINGN